MEVDLDGFSTSPPSPVPQSERDTPSPRSGRSIEPTLPQRAEQDPRTPATARAVAAAAVGVNGAFVGNPRRGDLFHRTFSAPGRQGVRQQMYRVMFNAVDADGRYVLPGLQAEKLYSGYTAIRLTCPRCVVVGVCRGRSFTASSSPKPGKFRL